MAIESAAGYPVSSRFAGSGFGPYGLLLGLELEQKIWTINWYLKRRLPAALKIEFSTTSDLTEASDLATLRSATQQATAMG